MPGALDYIYPAILIFQCIFVRLQPYSNFAFLLIHMLNSFLGFKLLFNFNLFFKFLVSIDSCILIFLKILFQTKNSMQYFTTTIDKTHENLCLKRLSDVLLFTLVGSFGSNSTLNFHLHCNYIYHFTFIQSSELLFITSIKVFL